MARTHGKTIRIRTRNLADVADFVTQEIPRLYRGVFAHQVAESLVIALKVEPPYKYVSRFSAYGLQDGGPGWFSDKQRRKVMAILRERGWNGKGQPPPYIRSHETRDGWHVESKGAKSVIVNTTEGARWTQNNYWQARQPAKAGWHKAGDTIDKNLDNAMLDGIDAVVEKMEAR